MATEHAQTIGGRIKQTRLRLGVTQEDVCAITGLSKGFYSDVENDKRSMSIENAVKIADALGVSVEWLIRGHKPQKIKCPLCGKGTIRL